MVFRYYFQSFLLLAFIAFSSLGVTAELGDSLDEGVRQATQGICSWGELKQEYVPSDQSAISYFAAGKDFVIASGPTRGTLRGWKGELSATDDHGQYKAPIYSLFGAEIGGVAAGEEHSVVLDKSGIVVAWGRGYEGENGERINPKSTRLTPMNDRLVSAVAAGDEFTLMLLDDGEVIKDDRLTSPRRSSVGHGVIGIAAKGSHWLLLAANGTVSGDGDNAYGQITVPPDLPRTVKVSCGGSHSAALLADGTVKCWGRNHRGQCQVPESLNEVIDVQCGQSHTLALKRNGEIIAWGSNADGESTVPSGAWPAAAITAGDDSSVSLLAVDLGTPEMRILVPSRFCFFVGNESQILPTLINGSGSVVWSLQDAPPGLTIDSQNGRISGIPTKSGRFDASLRAISGAAMAERSLHFTINLVGFGTYPTVPAWVEQGSELRWSFTLENQMDFDLQWLLDGQVIAGQDSSTLSIPLLGLEHSGEWQLQVTSTTGNVQLSDPIKLVVLGHVITWDRSSPQISAVPTQSHKIVAFARPNGEFIEEDGVLRTQWQGRDTEFSNVRQFEHSTVLYEDGRIQVLDGQEQAWKKPAEGWRDIVKIAADQTVLAGLNRDETVLALFRSNEDVGLIMPDREFACQATDIAVANGSVAVLTPGGAVHSWNGFNTETFMTRGGLAISSSSYQIAALKDDGSILFRSFGSSNLIEHVEPLNRLLFGLNSEILLLGATGEAGLIGYGGTYSSPSDAGKIAGAAWGAMGYGKVVTLRAYDPGEMRFG